MPIPVAPVTGRACRHALVRDPAAINLLTERNGVLVRAKPGLVCCDAKVSRDVDHILIGQGARDARHDRIAARRCFRARLRLVVLQLLDEILSVLARELWKCGAGAIAIRRVTRSAYLRLRLPVPGSDPVLQAGRTPPPVLTLPIHRTLLLLEAPSETCTVGSFAYPVFRLVRMSGSAKNDGDRFATIRRKTPERRAQKMPRNPSRSLSGLGLARPCWSSENRRIVQ